MTDKFGHVRTYLRTNKYINTQSSVSLEGLDLLVELLFMMTLPLKLIALSLGGYCVLSLFFFCCFCVRKELYVQKDTRYIRIESFGCFEWLSSGRIMKLKD